MKCFSTAAFFLGFASTALGQSFFDATVIPPHDIESPGNSVIGTVFTVQEPYTFTHFSFYDPERDGVAPHRVELWRDVYDLNDTGATPAYVASTGSTHDWSTAPLTNSSWRLAPIEIEVNGVFTEFAESIILQPGEAYAIFAWNSADGDPIHWFLTEGGGEAAIHPSIEFTYYIHHPADFDILDDEVGFGLAAGIHAGPGLYFVPEPTSLTLLGLGLLGLAFLRRRS